MMQLISIDVIMNMIINTYSVLFMRIYWTLCDGGEPNRSFIKMLFPPGTEPEDSNFVAYNVHTGDELVVMLDCKVIGKEIIDLTFKELKKKCI